MKKLFFVFAAAALLASCSQNEGVSLLNIEDNGDKAVTFEAFAQTAVTKGTVVTTDKFKEGIGVFAFYQPAGGLNNYTSIKYPTPDFMYNQKVELVLTSGDAGAWHYTPVKYWPNNSGDKLSFFAYAPYDAATAWEELGFKTNAKGSIMSKTFVINNAVEEQVDYLFAEPVKDQEKKTTITNATNASADASYADVPNYKAEEATSSDVIRFNFKHILAKVNLYLGVQTDVNTTASGSASGDGELSTAAWTDPNTVIEIQSIEFKDLYETYTWTKEDGTSTDDDWKGAGKQNIVVTPTDNDHANKIDDDNWTTPKWHRILTGTNEGTSSGDAYMFIAPQELSTQKIVITYVTKTTDNDHPENSSEITNVITKDWTAFKNEGFTKFETGKQYRLYFIIGMQGVKVAATITDWEDASTPESVIDVPAANAF